MAYQRQPQEELGQGEEYELQTQDGPPLYDHRVDEGIVFFRIGVFMARGFDWGDAMTMALRRDVDRQRVEDLLDGGATHGQVLGIVL